MTYRVGPKGQVVIPKEVRDRLGIVPGDEMRFDVDESRDGVLVSPAHADEELRGSFAGMGLVTALEDDHRSEAAR